MVSGDSGEFTGWKRAVKKTGCEGEMNKSDLKVFVWIEILTLETQ